MPAQEHTSEIIDHLNWLDIFYGVLTCPLKTIPIISDTDLYPPTLAAMCAAILLVTLACLSESCISVRSFSLDDWMLETTASILFDLFFWLVLALFARLLAGILKVQVSVRTCLIVIGWSFVPLLLKAPAACIANVSVIGNILSLFISLWFLVLVLYAFNSLLKLGQLKTLVFVLLLPPCLFFSYFLAMIFATKYIVDGLF